MTEVTLKPCPFCSGEAYIDDDTMGHSVVCCLNNECRAQGAFAPDDDKAVAAWNTRPASTEPADALAEAREALRQSKEGWDNAVEMGLLPPQHHATARELSEQCFAALSRLNAQGEVK